MARIAGVNIPTNKRVEIALTYIHGIGPAKAKELTTKLGITAERRVLSRPAPQEGASGSWPAYAYQCTDPQGQGQADRRQEEVDLRPHVSAFRF